MLTIRDDASKDHMTLNIAKCSTMRIAAAGRPNFIPLRVDGTEVPHVSTMKLLGVSIQCNLKWDKQVEAMVAKANTRRYFITLLKRAGVQLRDLVRCYCTYIRPLLEYAAPVWHPGLTRHQADLLEQVYRKDNVFALYFLTPVMRKHSGRQGFQHCRSVALHSA